MQGVHAPLQGSHVTSHHVCNQWRHICLASHYSMYFWHTFCCPHECSWFLPDQCCTEDFKYPLCPSCRAHSTSFQIAEPVDMPTLVTVTDCDHHTAAAAHTSVTHVHSMSCLCLVYKAYFQRPRMGLNSGSRCWNTCRHFQTERWCTIRHH